MRLSHLAVLVTVCTVVALPSVARNDRYTFPLQPTLDSPDFAQQVGSSVKFAFGDQPAPAGGKIGDYVSNERQHFHGKKKAHVVTRLFRPSPICATVRHDWAATP
jgi:hypothetical protein